MKIKWIKLFYIYWTGKNYYFDFTIKIPWIKLK